LTQSFQVFVASARLIVLFDERDGHEKHRKAKQQWEQARLLECGGKRSATPLSIRYQNPKRRRRFASGALQEVTLPSL
jgi:hypothetical protein